MRCRHVARRIPRRRRSRPSPRRTCPAAAVWARSNTLVPRAGTSNGADDGGDTVGIGEDGDLAGQGDFARVGDDGDTAQLRSTDGNAGAEPCRRDELARRERTAWSALPSRENSPARCARAASAAAATTPTIVASTIAAATNRRTLDHSTPASCCPVSVSRSGLGFDLPRHGLVVRRRTRLRYRLWARFTGVGASGSIGASIDSSGASGSTTSRRHRRCTSVAVSNLLIPSSERQPDHQLDDEQQRSRRRRVCSPTWPRLRM